MSFIVGFGIGLSLIVAIGAQNAFVLRQGVRRDHVLVVALVCAASDALLICLGVGGVGVALTAAPWLITIARWGGVVFLVTYAALAIRRALAPATTGLMATPEHPPTSRAAEGAAPATATSPATTTTSPNAGATLTTTLIATFAITWLNPHVYLDTVIFLGSVAQTHGDARWIFAAGAVTASFAWFFALAYGARYLGSILASPKSWRILDLIIAVFMLCIAAILALGS